MLGINQVQFVFNYDGGGVGKGGELVLTVNSREVTKGRAERTMPFLYAMDETASVGMRRGIPVAEGYTANSSNFQGNIYSVTIKIRDLGTNTIRVQNGWHKVGLGTLGLDSSQG